MILLLRIRPLRIPKGRLHSDAKQGRNSVVMLPFLPTKDACSGSWEVYLKWHVSVHFLHLKWIFQTDSPLLFVKQSSEHKSRVVLRRTCYAESITMIQRRSAPWRKRGIKHVKHYTMTATTIEMKANESKTKRLVFVPFPSQKPLNCKVTWCE